MPTGKVQINETKSLQTFRSRIEYLKQHLQVSDSAYRQTIKALQGYPVKKDTIHKALALPSGTHEKLNHPVSEYVRIFSYSRSKNVEFAIIELYNSFTSYLKALLTEMYEYNPVLVVNKAASKGKLEITYLRLIELGDFDKIKAEMISQVFRRLEGERSTIKLLDNISNNVQVDKAIKAEALTFLEMRHLFIHNSGKADGDYVKLYGRRFSLKHGEKLPTTYETTLSAIDSVIKLCTAVDKKLIEDGFVDKRHVIAPTK